jgi:hypothetical protein
MKYLITESQFDKIIFKYLDNQDFVHIGYGENIYLVNSEEDSLAQIKINNKSRWCAIDYNLLNEISSFFSINRIDALSVINKWVEKKFDIKSLSVYAESNIIVYYF